MSDPASTPGRAWPLPAVPSLAPLLAGAGARVRWLVAFLAGAAGALAMPPFGLWPVLFVSFPVAVWLIDAAAARERTRRAASARSAAAIGWWFGFGYFLAGLWWLGSAFLVDADEFLWALPLGVVGLPMVLALFTAAGFGLAGALWRPDLWRIPLFAGALALAEWLRATQFTGFPWNAFGVAFGQGDVLAQAAALGGLHWLTLLVLFIHATPATLLDRGEGAKRLTDRLSMPLAAAAMLALVAGYGLWRLPTGPVPVEPGVRLRIMQPNIDEAERADAAFRASIIARYSAISTQEGANGERLGDATHLIWPESAFPFLVDHTPEALEDIARMLPAGIVLITGAARADDPLPGEERYRFFNAVRVYDSNAHGLATYDKVHLVPFGEYLPFDGLLRRLGLRQFVHTPGGFEAGERREALAVPGLPPVSALICYEAIFPEEAILYPPSPGNRGLLLNLTNDAWFGMTPGPHQHFAQSRLRAIEQGLPLVRAANTGISAVIDPFGRPVAPVLALGTAGIIDAGLPRPLAPTPFVTMQATAGAVLYWIGIICSLAVGIAAPRRRANRTRASLT